MSHRRDGWARNNRQSSSAPMTSMPIPGSTEVIVPSSFHRTTITSPVLTLSQDRISMITPTRGAHPCGLWTRTTSPTARPFGRRLGNADPRIMAMTSPPSAPCVPTSMISGGGRAGKGRTSRSSWWQSNRAGLHESSISPNASTPRYEVTITVAGDAWSYDETTMLQMNEFAAPLAHTDDTHPRVG